MAPVKMVFTTRAGLLSLGRNSLFAFGVISAVVQFYVALFVPKERLPVAGVILAAGFGVALIYGVMLTWPKTHLTRSLSHPGVRITIKRGDLFDHVDGIIGVGFTDTFDTDVTNDVLINRASLQGQLLDKLYGGDVALLDRDITTALAQVPKVAFETTDRKCRGKLDRYPLGTVLVLTPPGYCTVLAAAYSRMGNEFVAQATVDSIWQTLTAIWDTTRRISGLRPVALPVFGSELGRVGSFGREGLIKVILMSFVARSRMELVTRELVVVVRHEDFADVNMVEIANFMRTL